jgi:hypothetical protein
MGMYLLTTTFGSGELDSRGCLEKDRAARPAYRAAAPSFAVISSYKLSGDKTIDVVEAASTDEAEAGARAIADATGTKTAIEPIINYNSHLASLEAKVTA